MDTCPYPPAAELGRHTWDSQITLERGAKKVEAYRLFVALVLFAFPASRGRGSIKHVVETTEIVDCLKEVVETVPDLSADGTIDLKAEAVENSKRKRGRTEENNPAPTAGEQKK